MMNTQSTENFFRESAEFVRKAIKMLSGELCKQMSGKNAHEFYRWWSDAMQKSFTKVAATGDSDVLTPMLHRSFQNGMLYLNMMNAFFFSAMTANGKAIAHEQWEEFAKKFFQQSQELYQENLGKYLNTPQFGLYREPLMKITTVIEAYRTFLAEVGDFSEKFNVPFTQSLEIFQEALSDHKKEGDTQVYKKVSTLFMSILGKQYDEFLKTPECAKGVASVIHKYVEFQQQINTVMEIWGRWLSIPTKGDMEEVYKELYHLKKKTGEQEALLQGQGKIIVNLNQKVQELETSLDPTSHIQDHEKTIAELGQKIQELEAFLKTATAQKKTPAKSTTRRTSGTKSPAKRKTTKATKEAEEGQK